MKKILLATVLLAFFATGCREITGKRIRGDRNITSVTRNVSGMKAIHVGGAFKVYIKQDSVESVRVEGDGNLLTYVVTDVDNGVLRIREEDGVNLRPSKGFKVYVSGPGLHSFKASGACDIYTEGQLNITENVIIDLSGASDVEMDIKAPSIDAELSGAGTIKLKGATRDFKVHGSGSTDIRCFDLLSETTKVSISGAGDAQVFASVKLDVKVSGAGSVRYKGSPEVTQSVSGAGSVKKAE